MKDEEKRILQLLAPNLHPGFVSVLLLMFLSGPVSGVEPVARYADRLIVTSHTEDAPFAERVVALTLEQRPLLLRMLGADAPDTIHIHVAHSLEEFRTYTFSAIPEWGDGYAIPDRNLIVLQSPRLSGSLERLRSVLIHELAHVLLHSAMRNARVPRWLDEGFAMYSAREWGMWDRAHLVVATLTGELVPLGVIHSVNTFSERRAELAYQESALVIQFILSRYGHNGLQTLLDRLRATGSIDQACFDAFGVSIVEFERDWQQYVEQRYGWRALPGEGFTLAAGPVIVVLMVFAYIGMRRRRRIILTRWEQEETAEYGWSRDEDRWRRFKKRFTVIRGGKRTAYRDLHDEQDENRWD